MDSNDKTFVISLSMALAAFVIIICSLTWAKAWSDVKMVEQGMEQVRDGGATIWKKAPVFSPVSTVTPTPTLEDTHERPR